MAELIKVLGQANPAANTQVDLYTVPAATAATCSTIHVCNQTGAKRAFRIRIRVAGAANDAKQFIFYDQSVLANDSFAATVGITLAAGDVVSVQSDGTGLSFHLFGVEVS